MTLNEIFCLCGTDKGLYHEYGPDYESFINPGSVKSLLEIGVWIGNSMIAWYNWLPNAELWGIDILARPERLGPFPSIHHVMGSVTDPEIVDTLPEEFDIIIDDGSHTPWDIMGAFNLLWPRLIQGGWYVVEDLYVNPGLENTLIEKVQSSEYHFKKHHGEILFMKKA